MTTFADYQSRYTTISFTRSDGILEMRLHTEGGPLCWGNHPHKEIEEALLLVGRDRENKIVILTGTGEEFSGPEVLPEAGRAMPQLSGDAWVDVAWECKNMLQNLLAIEVPMIAAINGPALRHAEVPLLCDIVLATPDTVIQDSAHYRGGLVPGDGMHVVMPALLGISRARYFLFTGEVIGVGELKGLGLVHEILPHGELMTRAHALAQTLVKQPKIVRHYTRVLLTEKLRRDMNEMLPYGLALEGLGIVASA